MNEVILTGCMPEFNQIGLIRLLIGKTNMPLHEEKIVVPLFLKIIR